MSSNNLPTTYAEDLEYYTCEQELEYKDAEEQALDFARRITNGDSKFKAYCAVHGLNHQGLIDNRKSYNRVNVRVWRYLHSDVVKLQIDRVQLSLHSYFHDKHLKALNEQFNLGMSARSEKVRADALNQFIQNTRNPLLGKPTDNEVKLMSESRQLLDSISNAFQQVSSKRTQVENPRDVLTVNPPLITAGEENPQHTIFTNFQNLEANTKDLP